MAGMSNKGAAGMDATSMDTRSTRATGLRHLAGMAPLADEYDGFVLDL